MILFKETYVKQKRLKAHNLREYRENNHIGLRELARESKLSPSLISSIELGKCFTKPKTAKIIENALFALTD